MSNETLTVRGASGTSYTFTVYAWGTNFNSVGGVYLVLRKIYSNGNYNLLYIGETGDLSDRFNGHHQQSCFDRNNKSHVGILVENSAQRRLDIEKDLLDNHSPPCND